VRFVLPEAVLALPQRTDGDGVWLSSGDADSSELMYVPEAGCFMRALFRVELTDGYSVTYRLWVRIQEDDLKHASRVWSGRQYSELELSGTIANSVEPWNLLGAATALKVLDPEQLPYCVPEMDSPLAPILAQEWEYADVLATLPD